MPLEASRKPIQRNLIGLGIEHSESSNNGENALKYLLLLLVKPDGDKVIQEST